jgi:hypothetical protein
VQCVVIRRDPNAESYVETSRRTIRDSANFLRKVATIKSASARGSLSKFKVLVITAAERWVEIGANRMEILEDREERGSDRLWRSTGRDIATESVPRCLVFSDLAASLSERTKAELG